MRDVFGVQINLKTIFKLSFSIPIIGSNINLLPIIMIITSFLQTKVTPQPSGGAQSAQQAKMMSYMMPIIIFIIFWNMPSALVLYWTLQNILTIAQNLLMKLKKA